MLSTKWGPFCSDSNVLRKPWEDFIIGYANVDLFDERFGLGLDLKLQSWSWNWSWSWYSGDLPELELELELKPPELELELIFWRFAGVGVGVDTSGVGVGVELILWSWPQPCSQGSNWQYTSVGSDNGLALTRWQAIIWINIGYR